MAPACVILSLGIFSSISGPGLVCVAVPVAVPLGLGSVHMKVDEMV